MGNKCSSGDALDQDLKHVGADARRSRQNEALEYHATSNPPTIEVGANNLRPTREAPALGSSFQKFVPKVSSRLATYASDDAPIPLTSRPILRTNGHPKFPVGSRRPHHNEKELPNGISMHGSATSEARPTRSHCHPLSLYTAHALSHRSLSRSS